MTYSPLDCSTLVDLLRGRALHQPDRRVYTFLADGEKEEAHLTYAELDRRARAIGAQLQSLGVFGERILLLYPPSLEYIAAFFGCLYAGGIAVPAYPPRLNRPMPRLQAIVSDAQARAALTTSSILSSLETRFVHLPELASLHWIATDHVAENLSETWHEPTLSGETLAFLQYTSGSTSTPKGVRVSHGNLLHNLAWIQKCFGVVPESRGVSWLPPYHDMGLIGGVLQPLYGGALTLLMAPVAFLQSPFRWLQAISRYETTINGGPNFAYEFCVEKITPEQRATLDLSSWEVAFTGAEPVRPETLERFVATFEPCGFRREAFYPCYGLAEGTLIVSGGARTALPVVQCFQTSALERHQVVVASEQDEGPRAKGQGPRAKKQIPNPKEQVGSSQSASTNNQPPATSDQRPAARLVGCGQTLADQKIVIADPESLRECPPDRIGEILVSGPSIAHGYWNQPEATTQTFGARLAESGEGPFLRTGDLGFLKDGELFVTGRLKDLIIIRGRNHYPQDIELTVERSHPALQPVGGAAFSVEVQGEERLVIAQEVERHARNVEVEAVARTIRQAVADQHEIQVYAVVLIKIGHIPRTSSGKIQRHACRAGFLDGTLEVVGSSVLDEAAINESDEAATEALTRTALLAEGAPEDRLALIGSYLQTKVARTLHVAAAQIDPQQPLSSLGLDSLMAVELQHNIESDLDVKVSMTSFLEAPSLSGLAIEVLNQFTAPTGTPQITLAPVGQITTEPPLAYGQRALWFLYQLSPESAAYNIASAVRILSALDVSALQRAFQALAQRHPALRTTFALRQGEPIQEIHAQADDFFSVEDAADWTESFLNDRLIEAAHRPFDLERGPLLRVYLFTQSAQEHSLLLVMHHIISDLWSLAVLMREVGALYLKETTGAPIFEPPTLHYTDYVHWQAERLAGAEGEAHWAYWQNTLEGELPVLNLPTDHPRPPIQTDRGALRLFNLRPELSQALKTLGQAQGATLYMVLLAAFQTLLYRYTGQEDLLVGSPTAGRSEAELAGLIGYFVNPIVIRADLSQNPTFESLLGRVRQTVLGAFEHQDYPLALLIERLQPARDLSRSPVFQVMFVLQKAPLLDNPALNAFALGGAGARMDLGGLELESLALEQRIAQFDLTLSVGETPSGLTGNFEYNTDLFEAETIARLAEHFETLLEGIVADPRQRLSDLPLLTDVELECLATWNETCTESLPELSLRELFERQAQQTPEALAVILPATADRELQQINYAELNQRAQQLAQHLKKLGVRPEVCVGLCLERSVEMIVAILGVLKAGGAYVPLDPTYPEERLAFIVADARIEVLITESRWLVAGRWSLVAGDLRPATICLDTDWDSITTSGQPLATSHQLPATNLACLIYTSGSTGEPKGVLIQNGSLVNLVQSFIQSYQPGTGDRILPLTSVASASFVGEVLPILCAGGAIVLPDKAEFLDFAKLLTLISEQEITILSTVPSLIAGLNSIASDLPRLRLILSGGETLLANEVNQLLNSATVVNGYGLTETTICSTYHILETSDLDSTSPLPIGKPLINNQIYILDKNLNRMPLGCPGELYIAGEGLARGYVGRPDLTAEKFIPNPFFKKDEGGTLRVKDEKEQGNSFILHPSSFRLYKTGDLARYLPNGNIEFLGRDDHQVKIRGFRIELGEIESRLGRHPAVREGVVVARAESDGDKRLVAYVTPRPAQTCDADELRRWLAQTVPDYMVPSAFVVLATLPLTSNGKVDLKALPAPDGLRPELRAMYLAPRSEMERTIAAVWQEVLKVEKVGIQDNFFELGGHSLLLVKVHSRLQEVLHQPLVLVDLFRYPTVSTLAGYLSQAHRDTDQASFQEMQTRADKQKEFRNRRRQLLKEKS